MVAVEPELISGSKSANVLLILLTVVHRSIVNAGRTVEFQGGATWIDVKSELVLRS